MRSVLSGLCALLLLVLPISAFLAVQDALNRYRLEVMPWQRVTEPVFVEIASGASAAEAMRALVAGGVLVDAAVGRRLLARAGLSRSLKAGEYRFERALRPVEVLARVVRGDVFLRRITFPEGLTRFDMARRWAAEGFGSADGFLAATADPGAIADLAPGARDLEGFLFPETYRLGRKDGPEVLVGQMLERFRAAIPPDAATRAESLGLTLSELVTLASLVEKETSRADERAVVAGVYLSRLRRGMRMQADPTVIYGLQLEGRWNGNLTRAHLRESGAYNTYANAGLPPGPIANPGRAALAASLAPAATDALYFVSRNDGSHVFSRSLSEHNRWVWIYQKAPFRRARAAAAAGGV